MYDIYEKSFKRQTKEFISYLHYGIEKIPKHNNYSVYEMIDQC